MFCYGTFDYAISQYSLKWVYPSAFISVPTLSVSGQTTISDTDLYTEIITPVPSNTNATIMLRGSAYTGQATKIHLIAIGRWK